MNAIGHGETQQSRLEIIDTQIQVGPVSDPVRGTVAIDPINSSPTSIGSRRRARAMRGSLKRSSRAGPPRPFTIDPSSHIIDRSWNSFVMARVGSSAP